jgi:hypothetical protein
MANKKKAMTEEAIDSFKEAIRIRPSYADAQKNLEMAISMSEKGP